MTNNQEGQETGPLTIGIFMNKPRVRKHKGTWEVMFGEFPNNFAKIGGPSWEWAIEAALRSGHKDPIEAVFGEQFLLNAQKVINRIGPHNLTRKF